MTDSDLRIGLTVIIGLTGDGGTRAHIIVPGARCLVRSARAGVPRAECVVRAWCGVHEPPGASPHEAPARGTRHRAQRTKHQAQSTWLPRWYGLRYSGPETRN